MKLYPLSKIKVEGWTAPDCADDSVNGQRYITSTVPSDDGQQRTLGVMVYSIAATGSDCEAVSGRTVALVVAVEPKTREKKMVTVTSDEMRKALDAEGRIALYGIYFDTNKSQIKPESKSTLEQIANLLKQLPKLQLSVLVIPTMWATTQPIRSCRSAVPMR